MVSDLRNPRIGSNSRDRACSGEQKHLRVISSLRNSRWENIPAFTFQIYQSNKWLPRGGANRSWRGVRSSTSYNLCPWRKSKNGGGAPMLFQQQGESLKTKQIGLLDTKDYEAPGTWKYPGWAEGAHSCRVISLATFFQFFFDIGCTSVFR